ncbi:uncharacterized protein LOC119382991 [Rhipicephalus sanguineus]|uniref:uncharacterized protein LOC119382991 n=1 Tax=Rhipicephalus sanguineus TaxID=34632 RepID=UPI001894ABDB|nr:uncharacterized protein LOC119382991 [Rhipicephalus sanguineus]
MLANDYRPKDAPDTGIGLLIGSDYMWQAITGEVVRCPDVPGLVAMETIFGWTVQGPVSQKTLLDCGTHLLVSVLRVDATEEESTAEILQSFWRLESMGITDSNECRADRNILQFKETVRKSGGRYSVALPWKEDRKHLLGDNRDTAINRLHKLVRRLSQHDGLMEKYDTTIRQYWQMGHAEVVPERQSDNAVYYMPHREVVREDSLTTKLRVVFDASSHEKGYMSLNDCLDKGTNLNPDLLRVLLSFRRHPIAINADIEKAFLQIEIQESDRDVFRFLWFENVPRGENDNIIEWRMTRVPFGSTSSPFLLMATIHHHLDNVSGEQKTLARTLKQSFYVDDLLVGADSFDEGLDVYEKAKSILEGAAMNLRKWKTNNAQLQEVFSKSEECLEGLDTSAVVSLSIWTNGQRSAALVVPPLQRDPERRKHAAAETGAGRLEQRFPERGNSSRSCTAYVCRVLQHQHRSPHERV